MSNEIPQGGAPKKGLPILAWAGIGCGTIVLIGVIGAFLAFKACKKVVAGLSKNPEKAIAESIVRFNPELEKVSSDDAKGELTYRVKKTGEEVTMSYKDIKNGKIVVKDAQGRVTQFGGQPDLSQIPSWVPQYPGASAQVGTRQSKEGDNIDGVAILTTTDEPSKVIEFFKSKAGGSGLSSSKQSSMTIGDQATSTLEMSGGNKELSVTASRVSGESTTTVVVGYKQGQ